MRRSTNKKGGFTLVEVIVVLVILAVLAAFLIPAMTGWIDKAKERAAYADIHAVELAARSAHAEVYALHPQMGEVGFIQRNGKTTPSLEYGEAFLSAFKTYLADDELFANVTGIMCYPEGYMFFTYVKPDTGSFSYVSDPNGVTITKL